MKEGDGKEFCLANIQKIHSVFNNIPLDNSLTHKHAGMYMCTDQVFTARSLYIHSEIGYAIS